MVYAVCVYMIPIVCPAKEENEEPTKCGVATFDEAVRGQVDGELEAKAPGKMGRRGRSKMTCLNTMRRCFQGR